MIYKLCVFLLVAGLALQTNPIAAQISPASDAKNDRLPPELKQNVLKLLSALAVESRQFSLPENRVATGTIIADLLWQHDEKAARDLYRNSFAELQNLFADINAADVTEISDAEKTEHYYKRLRLADLRREYVLTVARHDPQTALEALDALRAQKAEGYDGLAAAETELELRLASEIAKKDPDKTFALAKRQIARDGITPAFIESLKDLHKKDSALAARIGREILAVVKTAKIRSISTTGETSNEAAKAAAAAANENPAMRSEVSEIDFWKITAFINGASEMNRRATRDKKIQPLFDDAEMRELTDLIADKFLSERDPAQYLVSQVMAEITRYSPAKAQLIRRRVGAKVALEFDRITEASEYSRIFNEKTSDELTQIAERSAPAARDQRYADAARRALEENNAEKAQTIAERIKDRENYGYLFEQIKSAAPLAKARRGDLAAVRKTLAALKTNGERSAALIELASALAAKGDRETAKALLDESRQMTPAAAIVKTKTDLELLVKLADAYSTAAPDEAFALLESGIAQTNEFISAGIALDGFYRRGSIEAGELHYDSLDRQLLLHVRNSINLLKNLARADFARTANLADKFERPEIRLFVRLRLVQSLLDEEAAEKEKTSREQAESDD